MTPEVLHVVSTPSFMDFVSGAFEEVAPGRNTFVSVGVPLEQLGLASSTRGEQVGFDQAGRDRVHQLVAKSRIAVFHNVSGRFVAGAMAVAPPSTLRVWSGWGGDYYGSDLDALAGLVGRRTRSLVRKIRAHDYWPERLLELRHLGPMLRAAARSADVFSAPIPDDLEVFRRRFRGFRGEYRQLNYGSVEDTFGIGLSKVSGTDVLLGNSATPENNHLELLEALATEGIGEARVHAPLNYGDSAYAAFVARRGRELLGDRFVAITEPLSLSAYHEVLAQCSVFVMGHRRQQALGNIFRALWQGAHVVLDRRSPTVGYFKRHGATVKVHGETPIAELAAFPPLPDEVAANRAFLDENWGRRTVIRNIKSLIDLV